MDDRLRLDGNFLFSRETECQVCSTPIRHSQNVRRRFCSGKCRAEWKARERNRPVVMSKGTSGAINELLVCADLLRRGFDVFRSVSPTAVCDMIAHMGGRLWRVEVTCGYLSTDRVVYNKHDESRFDILAVVLRDGSIYYENLPI